MSSKIIKAMENIDDECDEQGIIFVKTGDEKKARSFGLTQLPGLVYFEDNLPNIYTGDLRSGERDVARLQISISGSRGTCWTGWWSRWTPMR